MTSGDFIDRIDHRLHETLCDLLFEDGPQTVPQLAQAATRRLRGAPVEEEAIWSVAMTSTLLVPRPTGLIDHALALLEGSVLTHRARAPLAGRNDLWLGSGVQPLLNIAALRPIPLADGSGTVSRAVTGDDALVGPDGWLPDVGRFELVGLRIVEQRLVVERVSDDALPPPAEQLRMREMLSQIYLREKSLIGDPHDATLSPSLVAQAVTLALLEDPELFADPLPPLDELLHNPLETPVDVEGWRQVAVGQQVETLGLWVDGVPAALGSELEARARQHGMSLAQFIVALLGTLAWRTPFAEDLEPWESWLPDQRRRDAPAPNRLRSVDDT